MTVTKKSIAQDLFYGTCLFAVSIITTILLPYVNYGDNELHHANNGPQNPINMYVYSFTRVRHEIARRKMGDKEFVQSTLNLDQVNDNYVNILTWLVWSKTIEKSPHYIIIIRFLAGLDDQIPTTQKIPYFIKHQVEEITKHGVSKQKAAEMEVLAEYYHRLFYFRGYPLLQKSLIPTANMLSVFYLFAIDIQQRVAAVNIQSSDHEQMRKIMDEKMDSLEYKLRRLHYYTKSEVLYREQTRNILINQDIPTYLNVYFQKPKNANPMVKFKLTGRKVLGGDIGTALNDILTQRNYDGPAYNIAIQDVSQPNIEQKITDAVYNAIKEDPNMVRIIMLNFSFQVLGIHPNVTQQHPPNRVQFTPIQNFNHNEHPPNRVQLTPIQRQRNNNNNNGTGRAVMDGLGAAAGIGAVFGILGAGKRVAHTGPNGGKYYLDEKTGKKTYIRNNKKVNRKKQNTR